MLITKEEIKKYLSEVPPVPENVKNCLDYLKAGELKKAALEADKDIVLKKQIESVVNSAYFALPNKVEDTVQLFSMIGLEMARNLVYSYLVTLLKPKEWKIFTNFHFRDFQANFMREFEDSMIEEVGKDLYKQYSEIGAIVPAAVCVCDSLLGSKKEQLELITQNVPIEYGTLIKRMTGYGLFGIAARIGELWGIEEEKVQYLEKSECSKCDNKISALVHTIFFYLSCKKPFLDVNSLIEFNPKVVEYVPKTFERITNAG
ncbi:MAG: HDOD domain-containing protein [Epsilonproteobacteria bacterium]|nr:HDOD domain-containing protein [Campylobacterota bacterium]